MTPTAMELKIPYKNEQAFTLVELILVIGLLTAMITTVVFFVDPSESKARSRDNVRLSDLAMLDRAINEYRGETGNYPDTLNTLRESTTLPGGSLSLYTADNGWIPVDLSSYLVRMPVDPINDENYFYEYIHNATGYELNARLEYLTEESANDGGNDNTVYEMGNNLLLISP